MRDFLHGPERERSLERPEIRLQSEPVVAHVIDLVLREESRYGWLASRRREMELADVRSIEVDRSLSQRMLGLGNVSIASSASADFMIRLWDVPDPERIAEILRQARLKRLA